MITIRTNFFQSINYHNTINKHIVVTLTIFAYCKFNSQKFNKKNQNNFAIEQTNVDTQISIDLNIAQLKHNGKCSHDLRKTFCICTCLSSQFEKN